MNNAYENAVPAQVEPSAARNYFMRIGLAVVVLRVVTTGLQQLLANLFFHFLPDIYATWWFIWLLSTLPLYLVATPLFFITLPKPAIPVSKDKPKFGAKKLTVACFSAGAAIVVFNIVGSVLTTSINTLSGGRLAQTNSLNVIVSASPVWATVLFACVCAPIMEELIFRKLLCDRAKPFGELQACILSGLLFGLFHGNLNQFFYATALGMIFAYVYLKSNNILLPIGMHMGINLLGSVIVPSILSNDNISKIETVTNNPELINNEIILITLAILAVFAIGLGVVVTGIVLFFINLKKLGFSAPALAVKDGKIGKYIYGNLGMIAAIAVMGVTFILWLVG